MYSQKVKMKNNFNFKQKRFNHKKFKKHFHQNYSIGLILNGSHKLDLNREKFLVRNSEIKIINPYEAHFATEDSSWEYINFMPDQTVVDMVFHEIYHKDTNENIHFKNKISDYKATKYFTKLYKAEQNSLEHQENLRIFISYLINNYSQKKFADLKIDYSITKSIEYIHDCFYDNISLDTIANISNLSKYHFIRLFKQKTTFTPHQYILNLKIEYALKLIQKDMPLAIVAQTCGFSDQSHFIRAFKERFGFTPSKL